MAKCPFAQWKAITGPCGSFTQGPFRIIHHTTEGSKASGAFAAFAANKSDPHFTVDATTIYQHIDTSVGARALKNPPGGVETNRHSALQIELVAFAGARKHAAAMKNLGRLCRWLEQQHGVPRTWPNGAPKPHANGKDPGGHNRNASNWKTQAGHYGHCHVPENVHWDPAFDSIECAFLLAAEFAPDGSLTNSDDPRVRALLERPALGLDAADPEVMTDHADVGELEED
jgi:hypothetical protein